MCVSDHPACSTQSQREGFYLLPAFLGPPSGGEGQISFFSYFFLFTTPWSWPVQGMQTWTNSRSTCSPTGISSPRCWGRRLSFSPACSFSENRGGGQTAVYREEPGQKVGFRRGGAPSKLHKAGSYLTSSSLTLLPVAQELGGAAQSQLAGTEPVWSRCLGTPGRRAWGRKGGSTARTSRPWKAALTLPPRCSTSTLHFLPGLKTFLTSELTWLLALAKAGCIYCVLTFCDFMLDTRVFF